MFGLIFLIPSVKYFDKTDELSAAMLMGLAGVDMLVNRNYRKYSGLLLLAVILGAYAVYSFFLPYNKPKYIIIDWIIQMKSFASFFILFAINPTLSVADKRRIRRICAFNMIVMCIALCCGLTVTKLLVRHVTYAGTIIIASAAFYGYCSIDENGKLPRNAILFITAAILIGCVCMRAKYLGSAVVVLYFMYFYRPGVMRHFTIAHLVSLMLICGCVLAVSWNKINYYFLSGNSGSFDPEVIYSYARPVMFLTGGLILVDHFPFGTGLASFGTAASAPEMNYSNVYYEYGIHTVHGLSQNSKEGFICDAFYPELAQFGFVGLILFIYFWIYIYSFLRPMARYYIHRYRPQFVIASCIICFLLIESFGGTTIVHTVGLECLSLLGMICASGRHLKAKHKAELADSDKIIVNLSQYKI